MIVVISLFTPKNLMLTMESLRVEFVHNKVRIAQGKKSERPR